MCESEGNKPPPKGDGPGQGADGISKRGTSHGLVTGLARESNGDCPQGHGIPESDKVVAWGTAPPRGVTLPVVSGGPRPLWGSLRGVQNERRHRTPQRPPG